MKHNEQSEVGANAARRMAARDELSNECPDSSALAFRSLSIDLKSLSRKLALDAAIDDEGDDDDDDDDDDDNRGDDNDDDGIDGGNGVPIEGGV
jgi:hypothetical protein